MGRAYLALCGEPQRNALMERIREVDEGEWPRVRQGIERALADDAEVGVDAHDAEGADLIRRHRLRGDGDVGGVLDVLAGEGDVVLVVVPILEQVAHGGWAMGEGFTVADCAAAPSLFYGNMVEPFGDIWLRDTGPIVVKGIQTPEDARVVADAGADAIVVSNHGGHGSVVSQRTRSAVAML